MVDIHSHILAGVDDGPRSPEVSLEMLRQAALAGVTAIVATPHCSSNSISLRTADIRARVSELAATAGEAGIGAAIAVGGEIELDPAVASMVAAGELPAFGAAGRHVLVELPMALIPGYTRNALFAMVARGFVPVLAHPERNHELSQRLDVLFSFISSGCLVQLEAGSLVGWYGPIAEAAAWRILEHDMCHFIASDAHSPTVYRDVLPRAVEVARRRLGEERADALLKTNPAAVLDGRPLDLPDPREPGRPASGGGGLFGRLRRGPRT